MAFGVNKVTYFNNCIGVFQGGGCRAIAYIGAYEVAFNRGIMFSELAGTSAGSIFAALIAAGATPERLLDIVRKLDFKQLKVVPDKEHKKVFLWKLLAPDGLRWWKKWGLLLLEPFVNLGRFVSPKGSPLGDYKNSILANEYGLYDSGVITELMRGWLKEYTGKEDTQFKDLPCELYVVAADVQRHAIKVWSRSTDPEASVAEAVTASCCIPLFFTPFDKQYIDGGVISNRPDFLFSEKPDYFQSLSFMLKGDESPINSAKAFFKHVVSTVIDGADQIQHRGRKMISEIKIDCGEISATDFDKIDEQTIEYLINSGRRAMNEFLDNVPADVSALKSPRVHLEDIDQVMSQIAFWSYNENLSQVTVVSRNLDWSWLLFPSLISWRKRRVKVRVYYQDLRNSEIRRYRVNSILSERKLDRNQAKSKVDAELEKQDAQERLLELLECSFAPDDKPEPLGFYMKFDKEFKAVLFKKIDDSIQGKVYAESIDSFALRSQLSQLNLRFDNSNVHISFEPVEEGEIFALLEAGVNHYQNPEVDFEFDDVEIKNLRFLNRFIRGVKYKQIAHIFNLYPTDVQLFSPGAIVIDGVRSIMGPIVVESHDGKDYVIEGNTRLLYAYKNGITTVRVLRVKNVQAPLPGIDEQKSEGFSVEDVRVSERNREGIARYGERFDYKLFRPIEQALRPNAKYLANR